MSYSLKEITLRTNNSPEGMTAIGEVWKDITEGRLPLLFDSNHAFIPGISPVSRYSNYESDENGAYDLTIMAVEPDFFQEMEGKVSDGSYKKYDESDDSGDISACTAKAWASAWEDQQIGLIRRTFTADYESAVPAKYTKDGKAHCYLYIAVLSV